MQSLSEIFTEQLFAMNNSQLLGVYRYEIGNQIRRERESSEIRNLKYGYSEAKIKLIFTEIIRRMNFG